MIRAKDVPEEWSWKELGEICEIIGGKPRPKGEKPYDNGTIPFVRMKDLGKYHLTSNLTETESLLNSQYVYENKFRVIERGSILIPRSGSVALNHRAVLGVEACIVSHICALELIDPNVNNLYLYYVLRQVDMRRYMKKTTGLDLITFRVLRKIRVPLPCMKIQKKIVALLKRAEQLKQWRKESDKLTDGYLSSCFLEMFGDPIKNDKQWDVKALSKICRVSRGKSQHRPRNAPFLFGGKYPFIQTGDIANSVGRITSYSQTLSEAGVQQSKLFPKGTIVMSIAANIGYTAVLDFDCYFPDSIVGIIPNENYILSTYLHYCLKFYQNKLEREATSTAQKNINLRILNPLKIPVPPIELQREFAKIVENFRQLKGMQEQSRKQIDDFFNVLIKKAFRGELKC